MTEHGPERRAIREAMTRLLEGHPVRSDGKLTIKSLAEEAGLKRWILTHRHQDLQAEFRDRIAAHGTDPEPVRALKERIEIVTAENRRLREQLREARSTIAMLERHIAVEALEATRSSTTPAEAGPPRLRPVPDKTDLPTEGNQ
ncbi:hypothetical protein [Ornithinimicrobium sp. INDO-MA30-4]|uniref:hypothetical protein n=1 Tax=Ornithinimicrobium sp. INDO-MA30-4 TaxID=2908651 RepID=UPI001F3C51C6|nr:hypothetical protein [Ornithinimicrobium sp. INDO-MA30-4]UJH71814.1 hypothetical protein L0A91_16560 [Ornithinimicrobium sp. INDO-MA30-4]